MLLRMWHVFLFMSKREKVRKAFLKVPKLNVVVENDKIMLLSGSFTDLYFICVLFLYF